MTSQFSGIDNLLDWDPKMRLKPLDNLNQVTSMRQSRILIEKFHMESTKAPSKRHKHGKKGFKLFIESSSSSVLEATGQIKRFPSTNKKAPFFKLSSS